MKLENTHQEQFVDLLSRHQNRLYGYIYALVQHWSDADDILQQTVLAMWCKFDQFEPDSNFVAWALRIAHLEVLNYRRSRSRSRVWFSESLIEQLSATYHLGLEDSEYDERFEALEQCMKKLNSKDRLLVEESYSKNRKIREIALALGRSSQSVCNSLKRIRESLLRCVDSVLASENPT